MQLGRREDEKFRVGNLELPIPCSLGREGLFFLPFEEYHDGMRQLWTNGSNSPVPNLFSKNAPFGHLQTDQIWELVSLVLPL